MNNAKRIKRLQTLIERINGGEDVARRDLKLALTADEWKDYEASVEQSRSMKEFILEVPAELKKYAQLLKKADFLHDRAEAMARNGNPVVRKRLFEQSETEYGKAFEFLGEALHISPEIVMWLDREFSLAPEKYCSPDPRSAPRLITSVSCYREGSKSFVKKGRPLKFNALQSSLELCQIGNEQPTSIESQTIKSVLPSKKPRRRLTCSSSRLISKYAEFRTSSFATYTIIITVEMRSISRLSTSHRSRTCGPSRSAISIGLR